MRPTIKETVKKYYRVDRREIAYVKFILEGYDGLAVMTTVNARTGEIVLASAPECEAELDAILQDLEREILIEPLDAPGKIFDGAGSMKHP
ncbi:MAG: DUF4911 domain-containing protein [Desulfobacterales bacterium]|nr:DUF4911 domain-containing protein [Desulfobacterales bacterium]